MNIITRNQAIESGLVRYFTGEPCVHGHVAERVVSSKRCIECARLAACATRAADPEKGRAYAKEYRKLNAEKVREYNKSWRDSNESKILEYARKYYIENRDTILERAKERDESDLVKLRKKELYQANVQRYRAKSAAWKKNNREYYNTAERNRRATKRSSCKQRTKNDICEIIKLQNGKCTYCKIKLENDYCVDHIIAISKGGSNGRANLQILCHICNNRKYNKHPIDFAQEMGLLL